ncbi:TIGR03986 family CRISPR-associated RAMP protein [Vibrio gazogenes]|uniref:CRISPR-associated protein n=1 Tax=Vibrio gazogenes DSM 21264 = NBRC 103151 TaxID=1123492 RepID=A0A1M4UJG0_VIBGA|nr:TIGR03986 family CRISPR-associated RAMP protein [Vibrio gazogenes]USP15764.1 TIGR03986 family CRISPR-associated RAMP protein [Vibrio gazogenes]SHE56788.1 CRISPR-associated protein [Vibrio gazogenes DSM 21264] [Vibrio gazogenes DSM 21264 = NBRC 103151]SJN52741.1 hypothetical protein BQ6471_00046 [Vibrio gazogenes]
MSDQFYNPYHFIPFAGTAKENPATDKAYQEIANGEGEHITHDRWEKNTLSGAIYVALTNKSDLIVGGDRQGDEQNRYVEFYRSHPAGRLDSPRQLGIPGNSLRGMIASTAEIISDSAMRVLGDEYYSVRAAANISTFSTLGLIVKEDNELKLKPLNIGTLRAYNQPTFYQCNKNDIPYDECFYQRTDDWEDFLVNYVSVYRKENVLINGKIVKAVTPRKDNFFQKMQIPISCFHGKDPDPKYIYLRENLPFTDIDEPLSTEGKSYKVDQITHNCYLLKGRLVTPEMSKDAFYGTPKEFKEFLNKNNLNGKYFSQNIMYCKGDITDREKRLASTKEYEFLIPFNEKKLNETTSFSIKEDAIKELESLLEQQKNSTLLPENWKKHKKEKEWYKVTEGDIYYFKIDRQNALVTELSFSQIWRKEVAHTISQEIDDEGKEKRSSTYEIMRQGNQSRYLPWGVSPRDGEQAKLTPAEQLFGVIETQTKTSGNNEQSSDNLASRVRFYDAIPLKDLKCQTFQPIKKEDRTSLTLSTPNPPSASMYMVSGDETELKKTDLYNPAKKFQLNGRKRYLQHKNAHAENHGSQDMITMAEALSVDSETPDQPPFGFCIEFDNLTHEELDLLITSTGAGKHRTDQHVFNQQLGMGKPYGFGKVQLDVLGVFLKDPHQRYRSLDSQPVYSQVLKDYQPTQTQLNYLTNYLQKVPNPALQQLINKLNEDNSLVEQTSLQIENSFIDSTALNQVMALADENNFEYSIHYPLEQGNQDEAFKWFANNDDKNNRNYQALGRLSEDGKIQPLNRNRPAKGANNR